MARLGQTYLSRDSKFSTVLELEKWEMRWSNLAKLTTFYP